MYTEVLTAGTLWRKLLENKINFYGLLYTYRPKEDGERQSQLMSECMCVCVGNDAPEKCVININTTIVGILEKIKIEIIVQ